MIGRRGTLRALVLERGPPTARNRGRTDDQNRTIETEEVALRDTITDPTDRNDPTSRTASIEIPRRVDVSIVVTFNPGEEDLVRVLLDVDDLDVAERLRADGLSWQQALLAVARTRFGR